MTKTPEKLDLRSHDIAEDKRRELLKLFPEARTEGGKIDFDRLKLALGEMVDAGRERYGLTWPGKAACFQTIQAPSLGTLRPCREESVAFDTTENLIIEGDNLEVLKLLQKSYLGKVKLIYIDPPYNTTKDFIYPDNYSESLATYLEYSGQADAEGRKFGTNTDSDGRYHSRWLSMMYSRLFVARNLLLPDGVLLVSVNDIEASKLRSLLDELFGEDCFVAQFVWNNEGNVDQQSKIKGVHEYVLCFSRSPDSLRRPSVIDPNVEEHSKLFNEQIENSITKNGPANPPSIVELPVGFPAAFDSGTIGTREDAWPHVLDVIRVESRALVAPARVRSGWSSRNLLDLFIRNGCIPIEDSEGKRTWFAITGTGALYVYKARSDQQGHVLSVIRNVGTTKQNSGVLAAWNIEFEYPKPKLLIQYLASVFTKDDLNALVVDFFAGSGTTAHALAELNRSDGGQRRFILVQLPEPTKQATHATIADITKARVRRALEDLASLEAGQLKLDGSANRKDLGFRVFKLAESNFTTWHAETSKDATSLSGQLEAYVDNLRPNRTDEDLLFEILLKAGYPPSSKVETLTLANHKVYSAADGMFLICLERDLTLDLIRAIAAKRPGRVVCLDAGFAGNDQLKANAVQIFKNVEGLRFETV